MARCGARVACLDAWGLACRARHRSRVLAQPAAGDPGWPAVAGPCRGAGLRGCHRRHRGGLHPAGRGGHPRLPATRGLGHARPLSDPAVDPRADGDAALVGPPLRCRVRWGRAFRRWCVRSTTTCPPAQSAWLVSLRVSLHKIGLVSGGLLAGLSIGREGPTVQVGAGVMVGARRWLSPQSGIDAHDLMVAGAAAGIAAAFNTPLGGIVFALEQLTRRRTSRTVRW